MIFRRKIKHLPKQEIEFRVNIVNAEALHIKRTGSYILEIDHTLPQSELEKIRKNLHEATGARWAIIQGGAKLVKCGCHG